jgi:hypothetical protein
MKTKKLFILAMIIVLAGCKDFEELQIDPNRATQAPPGMLLTNIETSTFNVVSTSPALASRMLIYTQGAADEQYYGWQRSGFGRYNTLRQVVKMEEEAERTGLENYKHLASFFRSYHFFELTRTFGDIPYQSALKGETETNYFPAYDRQEDIIISILDDLKTASVALDASKGQITGDIIYNGSIDKWKRLMNSFYLRILINLSKKTGNTKVNVIARFNEIIDNPDLYPLMRDNNDNAALLFPDIAGNRYPYFNNNSMKTDYYLDESFVTMLKDRNDPRLFKFGDREPQGSSLPENDFNAYGGLGGSDPLADNTFRLSEGEGSPIDTRYHSHPTNEASVLLSYAETQFNIAEAAALGWINADAETHYNSGVKASLAFYGFSVAEQDAYLGQPLVEYQANEAIERIITQKYIGYFMNGGWEAFYNHLRTGFPVFDVSGGGILNGGKVPVRWMYPEREFQLNADHVTEAVQRQYPEGDNINALMWMLQPE